MGPPWLNEGQIKIENKLMRSISFSCTFKPGANENLSRLCGSTQNCLPANAAIVLITLQSLLCWILIRCTLSSSSVLDLSEKAALVDTNSECSHLLCGSAAGSWKHSDDWKTVWMNLMLNVERKGRLLSVCIFECVTATLLASSHLSLPLRPWRQTVSLLEMCFDQETLAPSCCH